MANKKLRKSGHRKTATGYKMNKNGMPVDKRGHNALKSTHV